jgi:hypothetical protein
VAQAKSEALRKRSLPLLVVVSFFVKLVFVFTVVAHYLSAANGNLNSGGEPGVGANLGIDLLVALFATTALNIQGVPCARPCVRSDREKSEAK